MADPLDHRVTEALRAWRIQFSAGVALPVALTHAAAVCGGRPSGQGFLIAAQRAQTGAPIEQLLEPLAEYISEGDRILIAAGWAGGRAEAAFDAVVERRVLWNNTRRKIRAGMALPALVLLLAAFVAPLPAFLLGGSAEAYLAKAFTPLVVAGLAVWFCGRVWRQRALSAREGPGGDIAPPDFLDRVLLRLPLVGRMERQRNLAETFMLLGNLISAGVLLSRAFEFCARSAPNGFYRAEFARLGTALQRGSKLTECLSASDLFDPSVVAVLHTGEVAGRIDDAAQRLGRDSQERFGESVQQLGQWLPRLMYGLVCLYVIVQIFSLASEISKQYGKVLGV